jgi:hypothetical protein
MLERESGRSNVKANVVACSGGRSQYEISPLRLCQMEAICSGVRGMKRRRGTEKAERVGDEGLAQP